MVQQNPLLSTACEIGTRRVKFLLISHFPNIIQKGRQDSKGPTQFKTAGKKEKVANMQFIC